MVYMHYFDTVSAFTEEYNSEAYKEPWTSYIQENDRVNYNINRDVKLVFVFGERWDEEQQKDVIYSSATITAKNLQISCSDLLTFSSLGEPRPGINHDLNIEVYDADGNMLYDFYPNEKPSDYDTLSDCEKCDFLYKHTAEDGGDQDIDIFDPVTETFASFIGGGTIYLRWHSWK